MSRALSFLHVTTFYPPESFGGDGLFVQRLAHGLADAGHRVDVVCSSDAFHLLHRGEAPIAPPAHEGVTVHRLRRRPGWLAQLLTHQTGRPMLYGRELRELLAATRYDVVNYHNVSLIGASALAYEAQGAVKLYTAHEHWLVCPTHVLWKLGERPCESPECLRCQLHARRPPQIWRATGVLQRAAGKVDRFLALSRASAAIHEERGFGPEMTVCPGFIDRADRDWVAPAPRPHRPPYALFVGRLEPIKGIAGLIERWPRDGALDLVVVGDGSLRKRLEGLAAGHPGVHLVGALAPGKLGPWYAHCVACVVPSLAYEVFPTVALEAMARKAPVVARRRGGLVEMIEESGGGLLGDDDAELVAALERLEADRPLASRLGAAGYRHFAAEWTREAYLERYLAIVGEVAAEKRGGPPWRPRTAGATG